MGQAKDRMDGRTQDASQDTPEDTVPQEDSAPRAGPAEVGPDGAGTPGEAGDAGEAEAAGSMLVRLVVDFMRLHRRADGTEWISVDAVTASALAGLNLQEGQRAMFEQPGEFQMTGVLRRETGAGNVGEFWVGEVDPASLTYHIRVESRTLYFAGPEGCSHFGESVLEPLPASGPVAGPEPVVSSMSSTRDDAIEARQPSTEAPYAIPPEDAPEDAQDDTEEGTTEEDTTAGARVASTRAAGVHSQPTPRMTVRETRLRTTPWRLLTLGVEGTWEQWHRSLAFNTVYGEETFAEGERVVLIDDAREVDAHVHVLRLPPDVQYPGGRRVWLAEPTWETVRPAWRHV